MDLKTPETDPTPIFDFFRHVHATELLTAAVAHLGLFGHLTGGPLERRALRERLALAERPFIVLTTALRAMGLLHVDGEGRVGMTALAAEHLTPGAPFDVSGYITLAANHPGVLAMVERLRTNLPSGTQTHSPGDPGATHIFRRGTHSALETENTARLSTLSLAGRARNVAPYLAKVAPMEGARVLLDVGGGSGIYSYALLRAHPGLRAMIFDRPEVLKVAQEGAAEWGVADRVGFVAGNLLEDDYPEADVVLLSNTLHDWDVPDCRRILERSADALSEGGRVLVHDVFLNDAMDGPLPVALYSALLFSLSEGRAYSAAEYREWMREVGLEPGEVLPTAIHCGVLPAWSAGQVGGGQSGIA